MAKVKLADYLKKIFGQQIDDEIEIPDEETAEQKEQRLLKEAKDKEAADKSKIDEAGKNKEDTKKEEEKAMALIEAGWYDEKTGKIDETKIKDPSVLAAIKAMSSKIDSMTQSSILNKSLESELKAYGLNVSKDTLMKNLDLSNIKYEGDKATGVKEALEALKKAEPGFFKGKTKTPIDEGFNPVDKKANAAPKTLEEAFQLQSEMAGE